MDLQAANLTAACKGGKFIEGSTRLQGTAKLPDRLKWNNSANILCNYMREPEFLEMILKNQAIIPRYVIEPLDYLRIEGLHKIAFPMKAVSITRCEDYEK